MMQVFLFFIGFLVVGIDISLTILSVAYWVRGVMFSFNGNIVSFSVCMMFSVAIIFCSLPLTYALKYINIKLEKIKEKEFE